MVARGFGVDAGLPADVSTELARRVEAHGYDSLWTTDTRSADGLLDLAAFARGSQRIRLGVGVLPVDRHTPEAITERIHALGLDPARLWLGIGSGGSKTPIATVREAILRMRAALPGATIVVAAMGPKMGELAAELADGVLLNWLSLQRVHEEGARLRGMRSDIRLQMYVRAALDPSGRDRVAREAERYATSRQEYFAANGVPPAEVGVAGDRDALNSQLAAYEAVLDDTIVRALPASSLPDDLFALVEAAAPEGNA